MLLSIVTVLLSAFSLLCLAAPANHLEDRQGDKTYTITCLGPKCTDYPPTTLILPTSVPGVPGNPPPQPTTTPKTTTPRISVTPPTKKTSSTSKHTPPPEPSSTKKTSSTSKYTPSPENPPTKTAKSTQKPPTKTQTEEVGPSSTRCPVPLYYQCGGYWDGKPWTGCTKCVEGATCVWGNDYWWHCVSDDEAGGR